MKIIQSFYQIDKKICYLNNSDNDNFLINFYSLLFSYIRLKKIYGNVTVYCNSYAYDKILKFIPYDDVVFDEINHINANNYRNEWGLLKFHVFALQKEPFIHLDGDVFLFNDLLKKFINNNDDLIVQSIDISIHVYGKFYRNNIEKLIKYNLIDIKQNDLLLKYNGNLGYNNGVVGFRNLDFLKYYIKNGKKMNDLMNQNEFKEVNHQTMLFEQFNIYHSSILKNMKVHEVLPHNLIEKYGFNEVGNKLGYTHLLSGNKFVDYFIMLIRNNIFEKYPQYIEYIKKFEESITNANIQYFKHKNLELLINNL